MRNTHESYIVLLISDIIPFKNDLIIMYTSSEDKQNLTGLYT